MLARLLEERDVRAEVVLLGAAALADAPPHVQHHARRAGALEHRKPARAAVLVIKERLGIRNYVHIITISSANAEGPQKQGSTLACRN